MRAKNRTAAAGLALALGLLAGCGEEAEPVDTGTGADDVEIGAGEAGVDAETGIGGDDEPFQPEDDFVEPGDADNVTEPEDQTIQPELEVDEPVGLDDDDNR